MPYDLYKEGGWKEVARWTYTELEHEPLFVVVRFEREDEKTYRPGQAAGGNRIRWGLPRELRVPYRLGRLRKAIEAGLPVFVVEGEKSADAILDLDIPCRRFTATTLPGGSSQWNAAPDSDKWFEGVRDIRIIVDRDVAGRSWAQDVVASLQQLGSRIRLLQSRTTEPGDDVVDHLAAGFGLDDLQEIKDG
jgi:putative DNA primase/helicase